jgi:hypothetical protein
MAAELVVVVIVIALDGCVLDRPVYAFDMPVGPRMVRFGQPKFNAVLVADLIETVDSIACRSAIPITRRIGDSAVSEPLHSFEENIRRPK